MTRCVGCATATTAAMIFHFPLMASSIRSPCSIQNTCSHNPPTNGIYMARQKPVGRLDSIISQLEQLHKDAQRIFDAHVDELRYRMPGIPFGILKACEITNRAGSALDYVAALK